ncbi:MAG: hypothetical protein WB539_03440, partial [Planktothrix agardhii]|uniref:hypothetical protein n=1 Tax=Planktothrix agardhii TaxID=1160 RepID=UPI003C616CE0
LIIINVTEKAYESVTLGEPGTGVLEVQKVAIESIWEFSEMSIIKNVLKMELINIKLKKVNKQIQI